jgi:type 1 glutamine amidotransferase
VLNDEGNEVRMPAGEGAGAGHGPRYPFPVVIRDRQHPVTKGMPVEWMHPTDELYHGQRGPAANMHILATAYSTKDQRGTGYHEPMAWWIPYGEGRVFTTVLGHVGKKQPLVESPMRCLGFQALVTRGCEWAATGEVTLPLPDRFPTEAEVSLADE